MGSLNWALFLIGFLVIFAPSTSLGITDPRDVSAINSLYAALEFPPLLGWIPVDGDPCLDNWQGVACVYANITGITLNGLDLGGELGDNLGSFTSVISMDFRNNHIGGSIPLNLPPTVENFLLSANQFTGSIPGTLFSLSQLTWLSLSNNNLTGIIPDTFPPPSFLKILDLSANNLSGQLPPSMAGMPSLTNLSLQDNQLSGILDVLQDLPLLELDIENNLFSGPIPGKLLSIPDFRTSGNPFNTSVIQPPPASPPSYDIFMPPSSSETEGTNAHGPSSSEGPNSKNSKSFSTKNIVGAVVAGILFVAIGLGLYLVISRCLRKRHAVDKYSNCYDMGSNLAPKDNLKHVESLIPKDSHHIDKFSNDGSSRSRDRHGTNNGILKPQVEQQKKGKGLIAVNKLEEHHKTDMAGSEMSFKHLILQPPTHPPMPHPVERVTVNPKSVRSRPTKSLSFSNSLKSFTVASLQEYTNSFSQDNLIGRGIIGSVYRAELPDGKVLAIKKLDSTSSMLQDNDDFFQFLSRLSKLQHPNLVEIVGYCAEHGQRLLAYGYYENMTLHDALHLDAELHEKLSWNARARIALGAAKALEYMHEICQPAIVHQNFKPANILLDDNLAARVSDCGLATIMTPITINKLSRQLSACGYGAPELELESFTCRSDIYSFGVVMLELLTGRKSLDRSRPRGEQLLVRWSIPQLHDIDLLSKMVDPSLNGEYPSKSLSRFADIISRCLQPEPEFRPSMSEIVQDLLYITQGEA